MKSFNYFIYNRNGLHTQVYTHLSFRRSESRPPVKWHEYAAGLYEKIHTAVQRELVSDVPVGVFLSGGVDSSIIAAIMADAYPGKINSFSIGFEESSFDESHYARLVASRLGTQHDELVLTGKKATELVQSIPQFLDEPFADSSIIPTYFLSQFARQKVKVVLGGDGGDELFAGYPTLKAHRLIEYYERFVPWVLRAYVTPRVMDRIAVSFDNISLDFRLRRFLDGRGVPLLTRHQRWLGSFVDEEKTLLLQDWIKPVLRETYHQSFAHASECDAGLSFNQVLYNDQKMYLEGDILFKVDRASMANSLEVRAPFLNREVVSFANSLPYNLKMHGLTSKFILKKALRGQLPKEIINRPKKGFNMPVAYWLTSDLKPLMLDMFAESNINQHGFFNHSYICKLIDEHLARRKDNRKLLWTLLMFQMWYNSYI